VEREAKAAGKVHHKVFAWVTQRVPFSPGCSFREEESWIQQISFISFRISTSTTMKENHQQQQTGRPLACSDYEKTSHSHLRCSVSLGLTDISVKIFRDSDISLRRRIPWYLGLSFCLFHGFPQFHWAFHGSRDGAVSIAPDYGLDGQGVGIRVPVGLRFFSFPRH
jgi:hypothetical protein